MHASGLRRSSVRASNAFRSHLVLHECDQATATAHALTEGGDARVALSSAGANQYGCGPRPDPLLIAFGSSTASVVSGPAFQAAAQLHARLRSHPWRHRQEVTRLKQELLALTGASGVRGTQVVLAASGTDIHLIATQLAARRGAAPLQAVMAEPAETGSGVPAALSAVHFGSSTCQGTPVLKGAPIAGPSLHEPSSVRLRHSDGTPRHADDVDAEFASHAQRIVRSGGRCLLVLTDLSKTGLLAPSVACAVRLQNMFGNELQVLVDACQFRLAPSSLCAYLERGFMVAITGSKFVTGPAFCGALLLPPAIAGDVRDRPLHALRRYSSRSEWPDGWPGAVALAAGPNIGLLLRWEAALSELRQFRAMPMREIERFLMDWGHAVAERIANDPTFEALPVPQLSRRTSLEAIGWDSLQTIFPFVLYRRTPDGCRVPLSRDETTLVHRQLQETNLPAVSSRSPGGIETMRFQLGQPVLCGMRSAISVSALRMCASARWVATSAGSALATNHAINQAMLAFDKVALLVGRLNRHELCL